MPCRDVYKRQVNLELKEIEGRLADYSAELDCDPRELFQLEERINLLQNACDALKIENTTNPSIHVECRVEKISSKDQTSHTLSLIHI